MGIYSDILLTVDFDRTLTAPDSTIPQRNIDAIHHFMENGGAFTVNTGRSVAMFRHYMEQIPVNAPFLLYNGSGAYDLKEGVPSLLRPIELPMTETIQKVMERFPELNVEIQGINGHYYFQKNGDYEGFYAAAHCACGNAWEQSDLGPFLKFSVFGEIREPTVAHLFEGSPEELARLDEVEAWIKETFAGKVEAFRAGPRIVDVHTKGVSKITAARDLQHKLGKKILVCGGDAENDLTMLRGADYAFCPADGVVAKEFPNVCKCADGAVADVILEKIPEIMKNLP